MKARRRVRDFAEVDVKELVRGQDRDELLHARQERRVVHAGARPLADEEAAVRVANQIDADLLDGRDARTLADHDAQVELFDAVGVAPLGRARATS